MFEKIIHRVIIVGLIAVIAFSNFRHSKQLDEYRRLSNQYRERIDTAKEICGQLRESANRNISSVRAAVELLEELREEIYSLESCINDFSWDDYYQYWDSVLQIAGEGIEPSRCQAHEACKQQPVLQPAVK